MKKRLTAQRKIQIVAGVCLLIGCIILLCVTAQGKTVRDNECGAVLLVAALGIYLIFTKKEIR